jgi:hypothetical protein
MGWNKLIAYLVEREVSPAATDLRGRTTLDYAKVGPAAGEVGPRLDPRPSPCWNSSPMARAARGKDP